MDLSQSQKTYHQFLTLVQLQVEWTSEQHFIMLKTLLKALPKYLECWASYNLPLWSKVCFQILQINDLVMGTIISRLSNDQQTKRIQSPFQKLRTNKKVHVFGVRTYMHSSVCNGERCKINKVHAMMFTLILLSLKHNHMSNYKFVLYVTICISKIFNAQEQNQHCTTCVCLLFVLFELFKKLLVESRFITWNFGTNSI